MGKLKLLFKILGYVLKALWQLFLLGTYTLAKGVESLSKLIGKTTEHLLNKNN